MALNATINSLYSLSLIIIIIIIFFFLSNTVMDTLVPRTKAAVRRRSSRLPKSFLRHCSLHRPELMPEGVIIIIRIIIIIIIIIM